MEPFLGEVRLLPYNFAPVGWLDCDGSLLPIAQYDALFTLLGTTYGGDGQTTFALPDLRGRVPIHNGTGSGLGTYVIGQTGGSETVTLTADQMPAHSHPAAVTSGVASSGTPAPGVQPGAIVGDTMYASDITGLPAYPASPAMIGPAGGSLPHDNIMPTLAVRFCIAVEGIWPSQS